MKNLNKLLTRIQLHLQVEFSTLKRISPEAYKHHERMHQLYKEIDDSGYEDMPKEIYARWLRHVDKLKKEDVKHPQPVMRKTVK